MGIHYINNYITTPNINTGVIKDKVKTETNIITISNSAIKTDGFYRFIDVTIPQKSTVLYATLTFYRDISKSSSLPNTSLYAVKQISGDGVGDIWHTFTSEFIGDIFTNYAKYDGGAYTIDVTDIIQELVDFKEHLSNSIVFYISPIEFGFTAHLFGCISEEILPSLYIEYSFEGENRDYVKEFSGKEVSISSSPSINSKEVLTDKFNPLFDVSQDGKAIMIRV